MSICVIPQSIGALGTAGEIAAATADARSAYIGGLDDPKNQLSMGAAVVAAAASASSLQNSTKPVPALFRGLGLGLAPAASATQAIMSLAKFQEAQTPADKFAASLGLLAGISGTISGLMPPSPVKIAFLALSISATAAQALVEAREPLEQFMVDALDNGCHAFSNFFYNRAGDCLVNDIKKQTQIASTIPSPLVLDLNSDGVATTPLSSHTYFDHAADGFAERTGWVSAEDGLLVRDLNSNGLIDSGRELFGSETLLVNGQKAANGFAAMRELDANNDGVVDVGDPGFAELRVWKDADGNGHTDEGELLTPIEAGVQSINVAYNNSNFVDAQGNAHKQVGSYTTTGGQTRAATDVWFKTDPLYSLPTEWVAVSEDIAELPDAQGYGTVRDLHQSMAMDATGQLKSLVGAFTQADTPEDRDALVTQIIYHWAGVELADHKNGLFC